jgi:hypothetical protein
MARIEATRTEVTCSGAGEASAPVELWSESPFAIFLHLELKTRVGTTLAEPGRWSNRLMKRRVGTPLTLIGANLTVFRNSVDAGNRVVIQDWDADPLADFG